MRIVMALAFIMLPSLAIALSCMGPNTARELNFALESGKDVLVVKGTLSPTAGAVSRRDYEDFTAIYSLQGVRLMAFGRDQNFSERVTVTSGCVLNQWCGQIVRKPIKALFIFEKTPDGQYKLDLHPCPCSIYQEYGSHEPQILKNCLARGHCTKRDIERLEMR